MELIVNVLKWALMIVGLSLAIVELGLCFSAVGLWVTEFLGFIPLFNPDHIIATAMIPWIILHPSMMITLGIMIYRQECRKISRRQLNLNKEQWGNILEWTLVGGLMMGTISVFMLLIDKCRTGKFLPA